MAGVNAKQLNNLRQNNLQIRVEGDSIVIGVKRTDITDKLKMNLIAAVGSNEQWNDDLPNAGSVRDRSFTSRHRAYAKLTPTATTSHFRRTTRPFPTTGRRQSQRRVRANKL